MVLYLLNYSPARSLANFGLATQLDAIAQRLSKVFITVSDIDRNMLKGVQESFATIDATSHEFKFDNDRKSCWCSFQSKNCQ